MDHYSFNRPRRDGWLSWPCWLTDSGRFTHKVVARPAVSLAQDRESSPAKTAADLYNMPPTFLFQLELKCCIDIVNLMCYMCMNGAGVANVAAAASNGFTFSSPQTYSRSATAIQLSSRSVNTCSTATEQLHPSRNMVPPTPPTRDRFRLEPYMDRNGNRFSSVTVFFCRSW